MWKKNVKESMEMWSKMIHLSLQTEGTPKSRLKWMLHVMYYVYYINFVVTAVHSVSMSLKCVVSIIHPVLTQQEKLLLANREKDKGNEAFRARDYEEAVAYYSRSGS